MDTAAAMTTGLLERIRERKKEEAQEESTNRKIQTRERQSVTVSLQLPTCVMLIVINSYTNIHSLFTAAISSQQQPLHAAMDDSDVCN